MLSDLDPADRRFVVVRLTDKGQSFINEIFPRILANVTREMAALSSTELLDLGRLCKKVGLRR